MSTAITLTERVAYRMIVFLTRFLTPLGLESVIEEMEEQELRSY